MTTQTNGDDCRESGAGETSRQQFEAYYLSEHPRHFTGKNTIENIRAIRYGDSYWAEGNSQFSDIAVQWKVWQASRAAIEINLPGEFRESYQSSNMVMDAEAVKERLTDAGINFME